MKKIYYGRAVYGNNEIKAVIKNESSIKPNILILLSEIPSK